MSAETDASPGCSRRGSIILRSNGDGYLESGRHKTYALTLQAVKNAFHAKRSLRGKKTAIL